MNIKGIDKAVILSALYNRAKPQGMGFLHYDPKPMTIEEARQIIDSKRGDDLRNGFGPASRPNHLHFDYLKGRVMKVDISGDELNTQLYNRDNGAGAAESAILAALETLTKPGAATA